MTDLASRTLRTEEMPSGTTYGYVLPNLRRMRFAGFFPTQIVPVIDRWLKDPQGFAERTPTPEDEQAWDETRARLVSWMVRNVDGEPTKLEWEDILDPEQFPQDDFLQLFIRAMGVGVPKATKQD